MSDQKALARKLAALTATDRFEGKALRLGQSGQPEALTYVLQAIDDTMMQRDAVFSVGESAITLRVSGKRVSKVMAATADLNLPDDLTDQTLGSDSADAIVELERAFRSLAALSGELMVERRLAEGATVKAGAGVGVQTLSAIWEVPMDPETPEPMDQFVGAISSHCVALIALADGKIASVSGTADELDGLKGVLDSQLDPFHSAHEPFMTGDEDVQLRILDRMAPDGFVFLVATVHERACVALAEQASAAHLSAAWGAAFSR